MKIAILGFGTVGSGVYEMISNHLVQSTSQLEVAAILVRKEKPKTNPLMVDEIDKIVLQKDIEVVVEVIGGIEPAHAYIRTCLEHKKHVVTANKAVVAKYLYEFLALAKENNVHFLFEASTGGGIPWINAIEKVKRIDSVSELHGIFNGTSNYILDHMYKDNVEFGEILQKAQALGYAEADPSSDIDGYDIRNKLQISSALAFESFIPEGFPVFGIRNLTKLDIEFYKEKNLTLKLIASAAKTRNGYHCIVEPCLYPASSLEANVPENFNLASIHGTTIGDLKFYGQGAGKLPTANAVIQDILDISEQKANTISLNYSLSYTPSLEKKQYYVRCKLSNDEIHQYFHAINFDEIDYHSIQYFHIKNITADAMHTLMKHLLKIDKNAMMAAIQEVTHD